MPNNEIDLSQHEGKELWAISGRCFGDDDDSMSVFLVTNLDEAKALFKKNTLDLSERELQAHSADSPEYFIVNEEHLGSVIDGKLRLNSVVLTSTALSY